MAETLYRKYRPQSFGDVAGQAHVKTTLQNQIINGTVAHAYLFTGPRGTGKTSLARILAKAVNCEARKKGSAEPCNVCAACLDIAGGASMDMLEIDAASNTGADSVRENIIESVRFAPAARKHKVYIIDEVHMLSTAAFNALLKTLEEPPAYAIFILATTEVHKVPATILSRCQRFDFRRVAADEIVSTLEGIAKAEGVKVERAVLEAIARMADGGLRDAESVLGQVLAIGDKKVTMETASLVLPHTHVNLVLDLLEPIGRRDAATAVKLLNDYVDQAVELPAFLDDCVELLRGCLLLSLGGAVPSAIALSGDSEKLLAERAKSFTPADIERLLTLCLDARRGVKNDKIPQLPIELAIVRFCVGAAETPVAAAPLKPATPSPALSSAPPAPSPVPQIPKSESPKPIDDPKAQAEEAVISVAQAPVASAVVTTEPSVALDPNAKVNATFEDIRTRWSKVAALLCERNASLPLVFQGGEITSLEGAKLRMRFAFKFHADIMNQGKNRAIVGDILREVFGEPLFIEAYDSAAEADAAATELAQAFGGAVI